MLYYICKMFKLNIFYFYERCDNMKKTLTLLLAVFMTLGFTACDSANSSDEENTTTTTTTTVIQTNDITETEKQTTTTTETTTTKEQTTTTKQRQPYRNLTNTIQITILLKLPPTRIPLIIHI